MTAEGKSILIVSACLAGVRCRYDGAEKPCAKVIRLVKQGRAIPICPEQLGGLPTPRVAAERQGEKVVRKDGVDVTTEFNQGAHEALKIAKLVDAKKAILKARSPSCGSGETYDGTFTGKLIDRDGVFAELCKKNGIEVLTEEEI